MNVTDQILSVLGQSLHVESDFSGDTDHNRLYTSFNDAGVECEVGEFLYGLTKLTKPKRILETGTHQGMSTLYFGYALKHNGLGIVDTMEFIPEHYQIAKKTFIKAGLEDYINAMRADVTKFMPEYTYQLMLLDTEPQLRFNELVRFYEFLEPGGFVFIHDLHRHMGQVINEEHGFAWPWGELPKQIRTWVKSGKLRPFHFTTPRGLTGFYKPHEQDYPF